MISIRKMIVRLLIYRKKVKQMFECASKRHLFIDIEFISNFINRCLDS
jgi:hypothetical protein